MVNQLRFPTPNQLQLPNPKLKDEQQYDMQYELGKEACRVMLTSATVGFARGAGIGMEAGGMRVLGGYAPSLLVTTHRACMGGMHA